MMIAVPFSLPELGITLATYEAGSPTGPPLLLLHGNSLAADVFERQWQAPALQGFRLVAFDLPGHGQSPPASGQYGVPALQVVVRAAVRALRLEQALVVAHSLAGLLLYELLPVLPQLRGLLTVGAPPVSAAQVPAAFQFTPTVGLYYTADVTADQAEEMARFALHPGASAQEVALLQADIRRTHGPARAELGASLAAGELRDEVTHVATTAVPLAFVAGDLDRALHLTYYDALTAPSRWGPPVHLLPAAGHAPFLENPAEFNQLLLAFAAATAAPAGA